MLHYRYFTNNLLFQCNISNTGICSLCHIGIDSNCNMLIECVIAKYLVTIRIIDQKHWHDRLPLIRQEENTRRSRIHHPDFISLKVRRLIPFFSHR